MSLQDDVRRTLQAVSVWAPDLDPDDRYVPVPELIDDGLAQRMLGRLGGAPARVGHSAVVMGLASRLWSILIPPLVRDDLLVSTAGLVARDEDGGLTLGLRSLDAVRRPALTQVQRAYLDVLEPVAQSLPLSGRLVWANVAASLHAVPRVHALPQARALVTDLLDRAPLRGELVDPAAEATRRSQTCCLFYEVPGAGLCGDCALDAVPRRA